MATNIFISCKESRIENNRSFYGCFTLGPFTAGQSLTVANALRRTLLSECPGLGIISVTIENVSHEYSTLPGMRESVLDLLLNLKEIVLKKRKNASFYLRPRKSLGQNEIFAPETQQNSVSLSKSSYNQGEKQAELPFLPESKNNESFEEGKKNGQERDSLQSSTLYNKKSNVYSQVGSSFFKPVSGFLKVKGPGVVRAKDLKLPPFIECVDPEQYIATLAEDGFLCMKFIIMEGKGYFIQKNNAYIDDTVIKNRIDFLNQLTGACAVTTPSFEGRGGSNSKGVGKAPSLVPFSFDQGYKQAELLISKRKSPSEGVAKSEGLNNHLNFQLEKDKQKSEQNFSPSKNSGKSNNTLNLDTIFNPVTKISYMIEDFDNKITNDANLHLNFLDDVCSLIESSNYLKQSFPVLTLAPSSLSPDSNTKIKGVLDQRSKQNSKNINVEAASSGLIESQKILKFVETYTTSEIKKLSSSLHPLKKESPLHNIVLEIWTNGSLHPREALSIAIQNLASTFLNMQNKKIYSSLYTNEASYQKSLTDLSPLFTLPSSTNEVIDLPFSSRKQKDLQIATLSDNSYTSMSSEGRGKGNVKEELKKGLSKEKNDSFYQNNILKETNNKNLQMNRGIEFLNLPLRSYTLLKRSNINNINDLCNLTVNELELIFSNYVNKQLSHERKVHHGIYKKYVALIINILKKNGFSLKEERI